MIFMSTYWRVKKFNPGMIDGLQKDSSHLSSHPLPGDFAAISIKKWTLLAAPLEIELALLLSVGH